MECPPTPGCLHLPHPQPALVCLWGKAQGGSGRSEVLTIVLLAVLLHVNLVVALGWFAVGVTVCGRKKVS